MAELVLPSDDPHWIFTTELDSLHVTAALATELAAWVEAGDLLVLSGSLGAGKTAFTRAFAAALGVDGEVTSPTFVLSHHHPNAQGGPDLVHVDAYRGDDDSLIALDLTRTQARSVTIAEWGRGRVEPIMIEHGGSWLDLELTVPKLPNPSVQEGIRTDFSETDDDLDGEPRSLTLRGYGPRWQAAEKPLKQKVQQALISARGPRFPR